MDLNFVTRHVSKKPTILLVLLKKRLLGAQGEKFGGGEREDESTILEGLRVQPCLPMWLFSFT